MAVAVNNSLSVKLRLSDNGRIVIPAEMRQKLGIGAGDTVLLTVEGDALRIESYRARVRRVQESLRKYIPPGRSLADELIAERREEARREMEEALG
ncbi:MAG: AbrB/MazE/SpoVT family DNA-binding domain-containing protein [Terracidiphilus sp.]